MRAPKILWSVAGLATLVLIAACSQAPVPDAPNGLAATGGIRQVTLTWDGSGISGAQWFDVYLGSSPTSLVKVTSVATSLETYTATGLVGFRTYYFAVTARGPGGESDKSNVAQAQPWQTGFTDSIFMDLDGDPGNYIEVPHDPALNPTTALTLEGWVRPHTALEDCDGLIGKGYEDAYWVGVCDETLRSYTAGEDSFFDAGTIGTGVWTHFAVTTDGTTRHHYLNGVLVGSVAESGPPTASTEALRIGSDAHWGPSPNASLAWVRLWSRALSQGEIQLWMDESLEEPQPGLVASWPLELDARDALGTHHGSPVGSPAWGLDGTVDEFDQTMPVVFIVPPDCTGQGATPVHYEVVPFYVETTGTYSFKLLSTPNGNSMYIYESSFDPEDGLTNCVAGTSSGNPKKVDATLAAGGPHYVVVFNDTFDQTADLDYTLGMSGP